MTPIPRKRISFLGMGLIKGQNYSVIHVWRADFQNLLHPLLHVTHLHQVTVKKSIFNTKFTAMENVDTNWNLGYQKIQILQL